MQWQILARVQSNQLLFIYSIKTVERSIKAVSKLRLYQVPISTELHVHWLQVMLLL